MSSLLSETLRQSVDQAGNPAAQAVSSARAAFEGWRSLTVRRRAAYLFKLRRRIAAQSESLSQLIAEENGKPVLEALGAEVFGSLEALGALLSQGEKWLAPENIRMTFLDRFRGVRRRQLFYEPFGVIGVIGTWNYPLLINLRQITSALFAGNTVIWKPSELSPKTAARLQSLFQEAGFPDGVFTVLPGDGSAGEALVKAGCNKIIFTGRGKTGRRILTALAEQAVPSVMELSGMDAALVCEDADLSLAARGLAWGTMTNAGQSCVASRRIIAHQTVYPVFAEAFLKVVRALKIGDPKDLNTEVGPLRTQTQADLLKELIRDAVGKGAVVLAGGRRLNNPEDVFFEPTVLAGVNDSMAIVREEFFGPVALLFCARNEEEMVALANDSSYGLGASVWTRDSLRGRRLASRLDAGIVWVNEALFSAGDGCLPFGGVKGSGFGRVGGADGLRQMARVKCVEETSSRGFRPHYFPYGVEKYKQLSQIIRWRYL